MVKLPTFDRIEWLARLVALALLCALPAACDVNGFFLGGDVDDGGPGGGGDGGGGDGDGGGGGGDGGGGEIDSGPPCVPTPEVCDGVDNDCNNMVDEGFNLDSDPANCGACGTTCDKFGTIGTCETGLCAFECRTGFVDLDMDIDANGCEYQCTATVTDNSDACDLTDNDCDGDIDEDTDLDGDEANCGSCNNLCQVLNATAVCDAFPATDVVCTSDGDCDPALQQPDNILAATTCKIPSGETEGVCVFVAACNQDNCTPGFIDCDSSSEDCDNQPGVPGCEYECPVFPVEVESCNGIDDDCDGKIDETFTTLGDPCNNGADGICNANGFIACNQAGTGTTCIAPIIPPLPNEDCDPTTDLDCDGDTDEDGATTTDPLNCGSCGTACADRPGFENSVTECVASICGIVACQAGWHDDPDQGGADDDCLYACTTSGAEICDGVDNDCDKLVDAQDTDDFIDLNDLGANFCTQIGPCGTAAGGGGIKPVCGIPGQTCSDPTTGCTDDLAGLPSTCGSGQAWYCDYPGGGDADPLGTVSVDANCEVETQEQANDCDTYDNDCDGATDEVWSDIDTYCEEAGETGICKGTGSFQCVPGTGAGTVCNIDSPGQPALGYEECNGVDDTCDGNVDLNAVDENIMITFTASVACTGTEACSNGNFSGTCQGAGQPCAYWIDTFEATRVENQQDTTAPPRACSLLAATPWALVTQSEAAAACVENGKRLCTQDEWQRGCEGLAQNVYPYGASAGDYDEFTCNGFDWNPSCLANQGDTYEQAEVTGYGYSPGGSPGAGNCDIAGTSSCISDDGVADMSGNVREWTSSFVSTVDGDSYKVRGGSYTEPAQGLTCQNDFVTLLPDNAFDNLGFRCCSSTQPPQQP